MPVVKFLKHMAASIGARALRTLLDLRGCEPLHGRTAVPRTKWSAVVFTPHTFPVPPSDGPEERSKKDRVQQREDARDWVAAERWGNEISTRVTCTPVCIKRRKGMFYLKT